jgi:hypothetical protein
LFRLSRDAPVAGRDPFTEKPAMPSPYPAADLPFAEFASNADRVIAADPGAVGLDAAQSAALHDAVELYVERLAAARSASTRTPVAIVEKDRAKRGVRILIQDLFRIADAFPGTDDGARAALGIKPRRTGRAPTHAAPTSWPIAQLRGVRGGFATVLLSDRQTPMRRRHPLGVSAALVYVAVTPIGAPPPDVFATGVLVRVASRCTVRLPLPAAAAEGLRVWVAARWISGTGLPGPAGEAAWATVAA